MPVFDFAPVALTCPYSVCQSLDSYGTALAGHANG